MKGKVRILLYLFMVFTGITFSYSIEELLEGVEKTTFEEYGLPVFVWVNEAKGEVAAGYDFTSKEIVVELTGFASVFESLELKGSLRLETDFASSTAFSLNTNMNYHIFGNEKESEKAYYAAMISSLERKIEAAGIFFDFLLQKRNKSVPETANLAAKMLERLADVELAFLNIKLENLSSIRNGEPETETLETLRLRKIDSDLVDLSVLYYIQVHRKASEKNSGSLFLTAKGEAFTDSTVLLGGVGGGYKYTGYRTELLFEKNMETEIRKMNLRHDVLVDYLPLIKNEYDKSKKQKSQLTLDLVQGKITQEDIDDLNDYIEMIGSLWYEYTLEALKIETILSIMRGDQ